jgi:hypothetical protein
MVLGSTLRTEAHPEAPIEGPIDDRRLIWSRATQGDRSEVDARLVDARLADAIAVDGLEGNLSAPIGSPADADDQTVIQSGRVALGERP